MKSPYCQYDSAQRYGKKRFIKIAKLKSENRIERIGGDKVGYWKIIEK